jgi:hypothetical protein
MGIKLIANGVTSAWNTKVVPPVTRGLEAWFTLDTESSRFFLNRAIGKVNAAMIGAPAAYATHGRFKSLTSYLQTQVPESTEMTIVVVGKAVAAIPAGASAFGDANTPAYVANGSGAAVTPGYSGNTVGVSLHHVAPTALTTFTPRDNGSGSPGSGVLTLSADTPTDWGIRALRITASGQANFNLTKGIKVENSGQNARILNGNLFRIGSAVSGFAAEVDISAVAIYSVALTDSEIAQVADVMRKRMVRLGITV